MLNTGLTEVMIDSKTKILRKMKSFIRGNFIGDLDFIHESHPTFTLDILNTKTSFFFCMESKHGYQCQQKFNFCPSCGIKV